MRKIAPRTLPRHGKRRGGRRRIAGGPESGKSAGDVLGSCINALAAAGALLGSGWARRRASRGLPFDAPRLRWLAAGVAVLLGGWGILAGAPPELQGRLRLGTVLLLGLVLGNLTGRWLGLQKRLDAWARSARRPPTPAGPRGDPRDWDLSLGVLLALNPLLIPASIQEGLGGLWPALALKSVLDAAGLQAWAAAAGTTPQGLSPGRIARVTGPVVLWQAAWTISASTLAGWLTLHGASAPLLRAADLLLLCSAPAIAGIRGTPQANLVPTLLWVPILSRWLGA